MASKTWQTFAQTGKDAGPFRQWLLEAARARVAESAVELPVKRYIVMPFDGGVHACGADLTARVFTARTREGALVAYWDWMNVNWPTNYGVPEREAYDHYGEVDFEERQNVVDSMFDPALARENLGLDHLQELCEAPEEHAAPEGL